MTSELFKALGGVGMFLVGMEMMTAALREAAGTNLRGWLARFTTTPLRGVVTGAAATAVIQSSSATTVMTVGFVGAGLLTLQQAMGVIYGANIGTTATGWLVSILGFKLSLGTVALVALLPASLVTLLAHGSAARVGRIIAGLCLLLVGLDMMQAGVGQATSLITPDLLPDKSVAGFLALAFLGLAVTALIQSSSAAVAMAMVLLNGGAINLMQAAAIVVGMNIGTTFTALLASVGGSRPMRQTAMANLVFNLATSAIALPMLFLGEDVLNRIGAAAGPLTALLVFHTGFNLLGTALFLPLTPRFTKLITRLVPERAEESIVVLDRSLLKDGGAALIAAQAGATTIAQRLFSAFGDAFQEPSDLRALSTLAPVIGPAIDELEGFLADIRLPDNKPVETETLSALLHQADHLRRLMEKAETTTHIPILLADRVLRRPALTLGAVMARASQPHAQGLDPERMLRLESLLKLRAERHRHGLLLREHARLYSVHDMFEHTDAMRWLKRVLHNAQRIGYYDCLTRLDTQNRTDDQPGSQE